MEPDKIALLNIPVSWKLKQWRWHCATCGAEGWLSPHRGNASLEHDRRNGRPCLNRHVQVIVRPLA